MNFSSFPRRLLLIKPSSMGDVIHALPVVAALHDAWPDTEIHWLIQPAWHDLVAGHPGITQTISFPREQFRGWQGWVKSLLWVRTLRNGHSAVANPCTRKEPASGPLGEDGVYLPIESLPSEMDGYDLAIDLQGLLRSALMARCSGADQIVGLSNAREGATLFYSTLAKVNQKDHAVNQLLAVLDVMGIPKPQVPQFILPKGTLPSDFFVSRPFVVLHPYTRGEGKELTQEQVVAFAESLNNVTIVLVGKGKIMTGLPSNILDWSQRTTLLELIAIFRQASFIVSSDSGPMHLAAALQPAKTLAIHRWSDPWRVGPCFEDSWVWKHGMLKKRKELGEEDRAPGATPTLEEMKMIATNVFSLIE